ncbi:MAG: hypothetical protein ACJA2Y_001426 [Cycloclasticus pugetii]|jgi:hypothetical protein|uniref:hypothetical protein n=1 Tax=Cycloclasticus pugetii TaxID=34068 RepID=UPI0039E357D9
MDNHKHIGCIFAYENPDFLIQKRVKIVIANGEVFGLFDVCFGGETMTREELVYTLNESDSMYYRPLNKNEVKKFTEWLDRSA